VNSTAGKVLSAKYACDLCLRTFTKRSSLNVHREAIHEGVIYRCSECAMTFTQCSSLQRHVRAVHMGHRFACELCPDKFSTNGDLTAHCCRYHQGNRYACTCGAAFPDREQRARHQTEVHGGGRDTHASGGLEPGRKRRESPTSGGQKSAAGGLGGGGGVSSPVSALGAAAALMDLRKEVQCVAANKACDNASPEPVAGVPAPAPAVNVDVGTVSVNACVVCRDAKGGPSTLVLWCPTCGSYAHLACTARGEEPSASAYRRWCTCQGGEERGGAARWGGVGGQRAG